jgi:hypothetical protein
MSGRTKSAEVSDKDQQPKECGVAKKLQEEGRHGAVSLVVFRGVQCRNLDVGCLSSFNWWSESRPV